MDGDGSTPASGGDQTTEGTPAAGTPTPGSESDQSDALRKLQSHRDSLAAENERLKKQLAEGSTPKNSDTTPAQPEALTAEGVMALLKRDRELTAAVSQLKSDFPLADEAIFTAYDQFDSVEAFRAAAESSHSRIDSLVKSQVEPQLKAAVEAALAPYIEKYGRLAAPPAPEGDGTPNTGLPTREELRTYSFAQLDAFAQKHGEETLNRILYGNPTTP